MTTTFYIILVVWIVILAFSIYSIIIYSKRKNIKLVLLSVINIIFVIFLPFFNGVYESSYYFDNNGFLANKTKLEFLWHYISTFDNYTYVLLSFNIFNILSIVILFICLIRHVKSKH